MKVFSSIMVMITMFIIIVVSGAYVFANFVFHAEKDVPRVIVHGNWIWTEQSDHSLVACYQVKPDLEKCTPIMYALNPGDKVTANYRNLVDTFMARKFYRQGHR